MPILIFYLLSDIKEECAELQNLLLWQFYTLMKNSFKFTK